MNSSLCSRLSNNLDESERTRTQALSGQDAELFFYACEAGGFSGEEDTALYQKGFMLAQDRQEKEKLDDRQMETERLYREKEIDKLEKRRAKLLKSKFDYVSFREEVDRRGCNVKNHLLNTSRKAGILERHGLRNLRKYGGRIVPTHEANQCVIGSVFESRYKSSLIL